MPGDERKTQWHLFFLDRTRIQKQRSKSEQEFIVDMKSPFTPYSHSQSIYVIAALPWKWSAKIKLSIKSATYYRGSFHL